MRSWLTDIANLLPVTFKDPRAPLRPPIWEQCSRKGSEKGRPKRGRISRFKKGFEIRRGKRHR